MARSAEAYLQMWERATGVPSPAEFAPKTRLKARGIGDLRLGQSYVEALKDAGQPANRDGRVWTWNIRGKSGGKVVAVLTRGGKVGLIARQTGKTKFRSIVKRGVTRKSYLKLAGLR
jgi:hypothetical protein